MATTKRRNATRHEPITTPVAGKNGAKPTDFKAPPLHWRKRNDFGNTVIRLYDAAIKQIYVRGEDGQITEINSVLFESVMDYDTLLQIGYPDSDLRDFETLNFEELLEVLEAALEVNGLERLVHLLDPDRKKDPMIGESQEDETTSDGLKMESSTDSSSQPQD